MRISDVTSKRHNFYFSLFLLNINCYLVTQTVSKVTQAAWCLRGYRADTWIWKIARLMCILKANSCRQSTHLKCLWKLVVATIPLETVRSRAYGKLVWVFWSFCWILKTSPKVCLSQISEENSLQRLVGYLDTVWEGGFLFHFVFSLEQLFKSHLLPPWQPVTRWKQMPLGTIAGTGPPTSVAFFLLIMQNCTTSSLLCMMLQRCYKISRTHWGAKSEIPDRQEQEGLPCHF